MEIKYNRIVLSSAMSKNPYQSGLSLTRTKSYKDEGDIINIQAINPQTNTITTHLRIEIPVENIDDVIDILEILKEENNK